MGSCCQGNAGQPNVAHYQNATSLPLADIDIIGGAQGGWYAIFGKDYDRAINVITERIAWNDFSITDIFTGPDTRRSHVETIINSYVNLIMTKKELPDYFDEWQLKQNDSAQKNLFSQIVKVAGTPEDLTKKVMEQLVWATKDGSIKTNRIWKPRLTIYNALKDTVPEGQDALANSTIFKGITGIFDNLSWILPVGIGGILLFVSYPYIKSARKFAETTSGKS